MSEKDEFIRIYTENIHRDGADKLLEWLKNSDFFTAPASAKYHSAHEGGLCEHSLNVYSRLNNLITSSKVEIINPKGISISETVAICGLLHDICKVNLYVKENKSRKTGKMLPNGKPEWKDYTGYAVNDQVPYGHGEKSVYIISGFMHLTREEAFAIRFHMGDYADKNTPKAFRMFPLALMLHIADLEATFIDEKEG